MRFVEKIGMIELRPFSMDIHARTIHNWVQMPYAKYWGMEGFSLDEFEKYYRDLLAPEHYEAYVGYLNDKPIFLMEKYDPAQDILAEHIEVEKGDCGMHILVAPPEKMIPNFTWAVFSTVLDFLFVDENVRRIVVEPDVNNQKIHVLNRRAGFRYDKKIHLPEKEAWIATCIRNDFRRARRLENSRIKGEAFIPPRSTWKKVNHELTAKAISEFSHELILHPVEQERGTYILRKGEIEYGFTSKSFPLDHWEIDPKSIVHKRNGTEQEVSLREFILDFRTELGIPDDFLSTYLDEITSTLYSRVYKYCFERYTSAELLDRTFQDIEHAMIEGHPCFVANSGKIGFGNEDFRRYAPETNQLFSLVWLAGHKSKATFTAVEGLSYESVIGDQLEEFKGYFDETMKGKGLQPEDYIYFPVHPWQWNHKISVLFAGDIAERSLVHLGDGPDRHLAQQSIRTLFNSTNPKKYYTKTAMSILNMGFVRGLSTNYMKSTPPITEWINTKLSSDETLIECNFEMLGEVATVGYENSAYLSLGYRHASNKMMAALWRESPIAKIQKDEKVMTMASLLHKDQNGESFLRCLIDASGISTADWVECYLNAYFVPLIHCIYKHRLVFMPHGENIILRMKDHVPVGIFMKDITEEVIIFDEKEVLPEHVDRLRASTSSEMQILSIQTDVFDCFFRFLSVILETQCGYFAEQFWDQVRTCVLRYQEKHPELQSVFEELDLFSDSFKRCCLNQLQLSNTKQMLDLSDPINSLKINGELKNPIQLELINI